MSNHKEQAAAALKHVLKEGLPINQCKIALADIDVDVEINGEIISPEAMVILVKELAIMDALEKSGIEPNSRAHYAFRQLVQAVSFGNLPHIVMKLKDRSNQNVFSVSVDGAHREVEEATRLYIRENLHIFSKDSVIKTHFNSARGLHPAANTIRYESFADKPIEVKPLEVKPLNDSEGCVKEIEAVSWWWDRYFRSLFGIPVEDEFV